MSSTDVGREAETVASNYLSELGFEILEQNWRRPRAEIDIVAKKDNRVYFVEVKYRAGSNQGSGLEYITSSKLKQMRRGAELWVHENSWQGDYQLAAIEVAGNDHTIENFIDNIV